MLATEQKKKYTVADYMATELYFPYQLIHGEYIDWPSRTIVHQLTLSAVLTTIMNYRDTVGNKGFFVHGPIDVVLDTHNVLTPDFIYVAEERVPELVKDFIAGAPDLVVEILWEKNAYYDLRPKKDLYEQYGVQEYIIFDPIAKNADLYTFTNGVYLLQQKAKESEVLNSVLLQGLSFDLEKIFK
jgi:Uma2 family endonuclease